MVPAVPMGAPPEMELEAMEVRLEPWKFQDPSWLGYIGDEVTAQLYRDYK